MANLLTNGNEDNQGIRFLSMAAFVVVVVAGLKLAGDILAPCALAMFLAILSFPLVFWLQKKGWPAWLATAAAVLLNVAIIGLVVLLAYSSVSSFQEKLPGYVSRFDELLDPANPANAEVVAKLQKLGIKAEVLTLDNIVDPATALNLTRDLISKGMNILSTSFLVFLVIVFALGEAGSFPDKIRYILGKSEGDPGRFYKITEEIFKYLVIKTGISLGTGITVGLGVWMMGLDFPILWGLLAFALNFIPTIGSIIAAVPAVLLALVQMGWGAAAGVAGIYLAVNTVFGNVLEPMWMGKRLGLSTLVVVFSLVFWGWVWGPVGMLLSVPLTMVMRIMLENIPDLKWVAILLAQWPLPEEAKAEDPILAEIAESKEEAGKIPE